MGTTSGKALSTREKWLIAAVVAAVIIALVAVFARPAGPGADTAGDAGQQVPEAPVDAGQQQAPERAAPAGPEMLPSEFARRDADDPTAMGDVDAPIVLIEYSDYRCPYCGLYSTDTQPHIVAEYVETGLVRIEWRDVPIFGEQSELAALAARAAGEQGLFWEYNSAVFALAEQGGHTDLPRERLIEIAGEAGVPDLAQFEADLDSPELAALVQADLQEAQLVGVSGTPTFILGDLVFSGAYPIENFRELIDQQLEAAGATP
ncbi:MAG: thioredoxin domain-containing protein [Microbacteriaceae bacterium]|nr:thioredoxin domain-containing protein [Microbacteriaceae bacterium]